MAEDRITEEKKLIKLGDDKEYVIKPLSLKDTKEILPKITKLDELRQQGLSNELIDLMGEICLTVLKRTNPELTKEQILEIVELTNVYEIVLLGIGKVF